MRARRRIESSLREALVNGGLELHYQPIVRVADDTITGVEALLRWRHAERGMLSPAEFVPVAEETGLIIPVGEWVLRQACSDAARWPGEIKVAINLSPAQFKDRKLMQVIVSALAGSGLHPSRLELEITEELLLQDDENTLKQLHQLRELGVQIVMDDFARDIHRSTICAASRWTRSRSTRPLSAGSRTETPCRLPSCRRSSASRRSFECEPLRKGSKQKSS
jgi:EAL domain-containing protein (putative c-di-GMP-specific phosphodiesterase class I)